jgi:P-type Cu+ transporter
MTTHSFKVGGLHCEGCVSSVKRILDVQPGVITATVALASAEAHVEAGDAFQAAAAIKAVGAAGFSLTPTITK